MQSRTQWLIGAGAPPPPQPGPNAVRMHAAAEHQRMLDWCVGVRRKLDDADQLADLDPRYRAACRFYKWRGGPRIRMDGGFVAEHGGGQTRLDGLTSTLSRVFHPAEIRVSTGGAATGGAARGIQVDGEMKALVEGRHRGALHPYTEMTVKALMRLRLAPIMAQVPVGNVALRLGTTLDLVCVDEARGGAVVNVQVKTGFERRELYERGSRDVYFQSPYAPGAKKIVLVQDSHHARHMLQVTAEHLITQMSHGDAAPLAYSMLMVVSDQIVSTWSVPDAQSATNIDPVEVCANLMGRPDDTGVEEEVAAASASVRHRHATNHLRKTRKTVARKGSTAKPK